MTTFIIAYYILGVLAAFVIQFSCDIHTPVHKWKPRRVLKSILYSLGSWISVAVIMIILIHHL